MQYLTALIGAIKVKQGTITSSFGFTPANKSEICIAEVPFIQATEKLDFVYSEILDSNNSTNFPADETHSSSKHSLIYFHSFPIRLGTERGIFLYTSVIT